MTAFVRGLVGIVLTFGCTFGALAAPSAAVTSTHTLHGTVSVRGGVSLKDCAGADDQSDIHQGTRVRVRDSRHAVVGEARLGVGRAGGGGLDRCHFRFTMSDVPSSPAYYVVVAERPEGRKVTRAQLERHDWRLTLTPS